MDQFTLRTIDDAEGAGWQGLAVECRACRSTRLLLWQRLRRITPRRRLVDIAVHLMCEACKQSPQRVALHKTVLPAPHAKPVPVEHVLLQMPVSPEHPRGPS